MDARKDPGMTEPRLLSLAVDSAAKSLSRANVGDSRLACNAEIAR